jgi:ribose 5-phosphate isomerase B
MANIACTEFLKGGYEFGIVCCGTGIGIRSPRTNRWHPLRIAAEYLAATMAKSHNNANFIAFGGRIDYPNACRDA